MYSNVQQLLMNYAFYCSCIAIVLMMVCAGRLTAFTLQWQIGCIFVIMTSEHTNQMCILAARKSYNPKRAPQSYCIGCPL